MCPGVSAGAEGTGAAGAELDDDGGGAPYWATTMGNKQTAKANEYMATLGVFWWL